MFRGEMDSHSAFLDIQAGAGGTEAQDWAQMLLRMYLRWGEQRGFKTEVIDISDGEVAGIKGASVNFKGDYAYGWLRTETGVHRLVRKSPFDSATRAGTPRSPPCSSRRKSTTTSTSRSIRRTCAIDVYRSSGAGGQHVNKTESAVRLTHVPDGHRGRVPDRAQPAQEPRQGDEDAEGQAVRAGDQQAQRRRARCWRTPSRT